MTGDQWRATSAIVFALIAVSAAVAGLDLARWAFSLAALTCLLSPKVGEWLRDEPHTEEPPRR